MNASLLEKENPGPDKGLCTVIIPGKAPPNGSVAIPGIECDTYLSRTGCLRNALCMWLPANDSCACTFLGCSCGDPSANAKKVSPKLFDPPILPISEHLLSITFNDYFVRPPDEQSAAFAGETSTFVVIPVMLAVLIVSSALKRLRPLFRDHRVIHHGNVRLSFRSRSLQAHSHGRLAAPAEPACPPQPCGPNPLDPAVPARRRDALETRMPGPFSLARRRAAVRPPRASL